MLEFGNAISPDRESDTTSGRPSPPLHRARILVVEDEGIVAEDLRMRLAHLEYDVPAICASGEEALASIRDAQPDVVLMDIGLHGELDGIETAERIRQEHETPVIFITAYADKRTLQRAKLTMPFGYLVKPFEERDLHASIEMALYKHATDRRLRESERRYRRLFERNLAGVFCADRTGRLIECNESFARLLRFPSVNAVISAPQTDFFHIRTNERSLIDEVLEDGSVTNREILIRAFDGVERWYLINAGADPHAANGNAAIEGTLIDIDERKRAEEKIARAYDYYLTILEDFPALIWRSDATGRRDYFNYTWLRFTGRLLQEEQNDGWQQAIHPLDRRHYLAEIDAAFDRRSPFELEVRLRHADGTYRWLLDIGRPMHDLDGFFTGFIGVSFDVTERIAVLEQLRVAKDKAEQSDRLKNAFIENMSHEIRTPLNIILGFTDLLQLELHDRLAGDETEQFEHVRSGGKRLMRTVEEILALSSLQTGAYAAKRIVVDVHQYFDARQSEYALRAEEKGLRFAYAAHARDASIEIDALSFSQIVDHLIDNAFKFSSDGTVTLGIGSAGDHITIDVRDEGIGISSEYLPHVFELFSQEESGYTRPFEGIGLGLALCKRYVELNAGTISIESEKGKGTTVHLTFPRYTSAPHQSLAAALHEETGESSLSPQSARILIAEDEPHNRRYIEAILKKQYALCFADSGETIMAMLESTTVDLILMDLSLRGMEDGLQITKKIRSSDRWSGIPIVVLTAHAFPEDRERCLAAGADAFHTKPINIPELRRAVEELLAPKASD